MAFHDDNELNERVIQVYYECSINISFPSLTLALTYVFSFWLWGWSFNLKCRAKSISNRTLTLWSKIHTEKNFSVDDLTESLRLADTIFSLFFIFSSSLSFLSPLVTKEVGSLILSKRIHSQPVCRIKSLLLFPPSAEVCIRILRKSVKIQITGFQSQSFWFSMSGVRHTEMLENLHFKQMSKWCWGCWSGGFTLRSTTLGPCSIQCWAPSHSFLLPQLLCHACQHAHPSQQLCFPLVHIHQHFAGRAYSHYFTCPGKTTFLTTVTGTALQFAWPPAVFSSWHCWSPSPLKLITQVVLVIITESEIFEMENIISKTITVFFILKSQNSLPVLLNQCRIHWSPT